MNGYTPSLLILRDRLLFLHSTVDPHISESYLFSLIPLNWLTPFLNFAR